MKSPLHSGCTFLPGRLALCGAAIASALLAGLLAADGRQWAFVALGTAGAILLAVISIRRPWMPYCLIVAIMSAALYVYAGPQIHFGPISIWIIEAVFGVVVVISVGLGIVSGAYGGRRVRFIEVAMLLVVVGVAFGFWVAMSKGLSFFAAAQSARNAVFFAAFWPAIAAFDSRRGRVAVIRVASVMAIITVVLQVAQVIAGEGHHIFVTGTYANMVGLEVLTGALRVRPPGGTLVYIVAAFAGCYLLWGPRRHRLLIGLMLVMCIVGLLISQNRNMLVGLPFGILAASVLSGRASRAVVVGFVFAGLVVALVPLATVLTGEFGTSTEGRLVARIISIGNLQEVDATSLSDRTYENRHAWKTLTESPITGVGWGIPYGAMIQGAPRLWIHNGYLWLWLRLGIVAAGCFVVALFVAIRVGALWQRSAGESGETWLGSGLIASLVALMASAFVGTYFYEPNSVVFLMGLLALATSMQPFIRRVELPPKARELAKKLTLAG